MKDKVEPRLSEVGMGGQKTFFTFFLDKWDWTGYITNITNNQ